MAKEIWPNLAHWDDGGYLLRAIFGTTTWGMLGVQALEALFITRN